MADRTPFLKLEHVDKIYGTTVQTQVLFDINLEFEEHSFNSVIGQSGSGKSTLLNIMGTLDQPTAGKVYVGGVQADQMKPKELARLRNETIGFIFQFHYLLPEYSALENVLLPAQIKSQTPTPEILARAEELMELVGISSVKNNNAIKMSGGQQQRTAIARALINNPKLVLADEPTGNLDSDSTELVYSLLKEINQKYGTTFIIVTHDRKVAERTDRITEIKDGRIILDVRT